MRKLSYTEARDHFLAIKAKSPSDDLQLFAEIGAYVFERWQAEESLRDPEKPLDEPATDHVWSECTERYFSDLHRSMHELISAEMSTGRLSAFMDAVRLQISPYRGGLSVGKWLLLESMGAIVGAISIVIFAVVVGALLPDVARKAGEELGHLLRVGEHEKASGPAPVIDIPMDANLVAPAVQQAR